MQIQNAQSPGTPSSIVRADSIPGNERTGKNGGAKVKSDDTSFPGVGFHLLASQLRPLPLFEVAMLTGNEESRELLKMIDTETKQLQAIEDLYLIVRAQPKYKKMKEPNWKTDTNPVIVLLWLLRKLGPLAQGNNWTVDTYQQGNRTRYRFVVFKHYHAQKVKDREEYLPLDFLPNLKKRDLPLHNLIIDTVALISKENKVPLWDEDGDFSEMLESLLAQKVSSDNNTLEKQRLSYSTGPASQYLAILKERRKIVTPENVRQGLKEYNANSQRKCSLVWWIKSGLALAMSGKHITTNTFIPNYVEGNPVSPYRLYKFIWSLHDNDVLKVKAFGKLNRDNKCGSFLPMQFSIAKPGQKIEPILNDSYPELLYDFMSTGVAILLWRYTEYFYKNQLKELQTPSETLLEQYDILLEKIESEEIKNLGK